LKKTILLLVSTFTVTLFSFTYTTHVFAQRYPRHQHPHPPQQPSQQPSQQPAGPTLDQLKAKDFTVRTLDGQSVSLNTLLGEGKPVLIDFWATWCGPCRMVIPHLGEMHRKYGKDGLIVIGMNLDDQAAEGAVRNFVKSYKMDYQNVFAPHAIYQFFSGMAVARIPFTLLFGPDGTISWRLVGYSPQMSGALNSAVAKALAGAPVKPAEQGAPEKPAEQSAPEKPAEQSAPEKPAEQGAPGKPAERTTEPSAPEKTAGQGAPEKQVEQGAPENPTEKGGPETKSCNCKCPCCSSPAEEKKIEQGAPEKQPEQ
jgi:thiol-disulfide isomerase/thioredoxin